MSVAHPRPASPSWLRLPRRTARLRLTALYGGLFLLTGAALAAITYVLFERATEYRTPPLPKIPHTPAIGNLQLPSPLAKTLPQQYDLLQQQLAQAQNQLSPGPASAGGTAWRVRFATQDQQLTQDQHQLTQDQHQLAQSVHQLAQSVHQLAQTGTVQAAQRAADSHQLLVNSGIALAIAAVLALLAGWLVAGRMLRPIRTITRTARQDLLHQPARAPGPRRPGRRAQGTRGHPRRPLRAARSRLRGPAALRRQRLPRAAHPPDGRAHPPPGCARRPRHDDRRMAFHRRGGARLQR